MAEQDSKRPAIGQVSQGPSLTDEVTAYAHFAQGAMVTTELAVLAQRHLLIGRCAGGRAIVEGGPCDHCGSSDPSTECNFVRLGAQIGQPLITG